MSLSEKFSAPAKIDIAVDFPDPCGPSKTVIVSNLQPGLRTRRTAAMSMARLIAVLSGVFAAPKYLANNAERRGCLSHAIRSR
jgi:hypothetical protein